LLVGQHVLAKAAQRRQPLGDGGKPALFSGSSAALTPVSGVSFQHAAVQPTTETIRWRCSVSMRANSLIHAHLVPVCRQHRAISRSIFAMHHCCGSGELMKIVDHCNARLPKPGQ
jgi:hypothetical protein